MTNSVLYQQCTLQNNAIKQVCWIPEEFAVLGKLLKVKKDRDAWVDGWTVIEVSETKKSLDTIKYQPHEAKSLWKATSGPYPRGNK